MRCIRNFKMFAQSVDKSAGREYDVIASGRGAIPHRRYSPRTCVASRTGEIPVPTVQSGWKKRKSVFSVRLDLYKSGRFCVPRRSYANRKKKITWKISAAYVAKLALLTALAFALYLAKFNLPFMFPSFLEVQFSELPALLAGFSMGPVAGGLVIVLKCLLKFPLTSTAFVGELTDMLLGLLFVLPASIMYAIKKNRRSAAIGVSVGVIAGVIAAVIINRFISVPFYTELYFGGNFEAIINTCSVIYPNANEQNFYAFYLGLGIVPFNLLRFP